MKKIVLIATAFVFSVSLFAQESKVAHKTKPESTKPVPAEAKKPEVKMVQETVVAPAQDQPSPDNAIKVNTVKHDFGKIKQGTPVTYAFELKNITDKPIVVENTYASCGCTTPEKIVEPIAPGATAKLKVQYNAANPGAFTKDVHIKLAGIAQEKIVQITGDVVPAEQPKPNN
jgi:Protein of unknown function (DUF1573)